MDCPDQNEPAEYEDPDGGRWADLLQIQLVLVFHRRIDGYIYYSFNLKCIQMIQNESPTFLYTVNTNELGKHFKELPGESRSPYKQYVSKSFYGAVIRSKISLVSLDQEKVVVSIRLKGRQSARQSVTGVKIDLMKMDDPRIEKYGIEPGQLEEITIQVDSNIPGNIVLNSGESMASAYFYKSQDGSSLINFVAVKD